MSPWSRIKAILDRALPADAAERERILAEECGRNQALRREVEEYLRYERCASAVVSPTAWREAAEVAPDEPPKHIGNFRIVKELAHGGMGAVYLAERDDGEFTQSAAIKVVRPGARSELLSELFRHERQILARLNHPHIAALMDGGTTPDGKPYFVMEYVEGEPLLDWSRKLDLRARLRLFLGICGAVAYAHRMLLIHGDLKPANILVTQDGVPKLLDFGIARACGETAPAALAASPLPLLTPLYASPEQLRGEPLTTATDIYSLGVVLYELISNRLPFPCAGRPAAETVALICTQQPLPPSRTTGIEAGKARRPRIDPGLDAIVLTALRPRPEERYVSVEAFQADLENYLRGFPVLARKGGPAYRLDRFARRNKWAVASAIAALVGIVAAFAAVWRAGQEAQMRFDQLRQFARAVVFDVYAEVERLPGSTKARGLLVERSVAYLHSLQEGRARDPRLTWELAEAYARIGDAQGNPGMPNLGDLDGAMESYGRARSLLREMLSVSPENPHAIRSLAGVTGNMAVLAHARGEVDRARAMHRETADLLEATARRSSELPALKAAALAQWNVAAGSAALHDWEAAIRSWKQVLASYEQLARLQPGDGNALRNVALSHKRLGAALTQQDDLASAERHYREAERIDAARVASEPSNFEAKTDLAFDLSDLGLVLATLGRPREAAEKYAEALALRRQLAAADTNDRRALGSVARSLKRLGILNGSIGEFDAAIAHLGEAERIFSALCAGDPANRDSRIEYAIALTHLGEAYAGAAERKPEPPAARAHWSAALQRYRRARENFALLPAEVKFTATDQAQVDRIPKEIERCRKALTGRDTPGRARR